MVRQNALVIYFFTYIIFVKRSIDLFFSHFLSILIFFHILPHILPPLSILSFPPTQVTSLLLLPGPNFSLLFAVAMNSMLVHLSKTVVLIRTMLTNLHAVLMQPLLEETKEYVVLWSVLVPTQANTIQMHHAHLGHLSALQPNMAKPILSKHCLILVLM